VLKMKKIIPIILISLLLINVAFAFNWMDLFIVEEQVVKPASSNLLDEDKIIKLANNNLQALEVVRKSGVKSLTIKTDQRKVTLMYQDGKIVKASGRGEYTIRTTEKQLNEMYNKYNDGSLTLRDVRNNFRIPFRLYWKVIMNVWG
tara:strand:+ start:365 stop:802 length:438 start_codon:yes stop_codon:yes gene_type:complete